MPRAKASISNAIENWAYSRQVLFTSWKICCARVLQAQSLLPTADLSCHFWLLVETRQCSPTLAAGLYGDSPNSPNFPSNYISESGFSASEIYFLPVSPPYTNTCVLSTSTSAHFVSRNYYRNQPYEYSYMRLCGVGVAGRSHYL